MGYQNLMLTARMSDDFGIAQNVPIVPPVVVDNAPHPAYFIPMIRPNSNLDHYDSAEAFFDRYRTDSDSSSSDSNPAILQVEKPEMMHMTTFF